MEYIPAGDRIDHRYDFESVDVTNVLLPSDLYADDFVYLNRDIAAIRLFKEEVHKTEKGRKSKKGKKETKDKDRKLIERVEKKEDKKRNYEGTPSIYSATPIQGKLFERSRATKHMECIGEELDIEPQAAKHDENSQLKVQMSKRGGMTARPKKMIEVSFRHGEYWGKDPILRRLGSALEHTKVATSTMRRMGDEMTKLVKKTHDAKSSVEGGKAVTEIITQPSLDEMIAWSLKGAKFQLQYSRQSKIHKELCSHFYKKMSKRLQKLEEESQNEDIDDTASVWSDSSHTSLGSQSSTSSFHGTATPLDETQQSAITSDRSDKSHESSGEDDDDDDDDQKTGGALLASKLDKLSGEYLQREINAQNASRKVQIQDKRSVQAGREAAAAKRRMTLADMMGAANIAHMLRRKQQKEKSVQRTAKKKGKSSNYIYFDGELVRFEDVPEHLRDMIPKEANYFHEHTVAPTTKYTKSIIDVVNKSTGLGSVGDAPKSVPLRDMQLKALATRKAKELSKGDCTSIDPNEVVKSLCSEGILIKEHMKRLQSVKGSFGKGQIPTEATFDRESHDMLCRSQASIAASKQNSSKVLDQWEHYLDRSQEVAMKNNWDFEDKDFLRPLSILDRLKMKCGETETPLDSVVQTTKVKDIENHQQQQSQHYPNDQKYRMVNGETFLTEKNVGRPHSFTDTTNTLSTMVPSAPTNPRTSSPSIRRKTFNAKLLLQEQKFHHMQNKQQARIYLNKKWFLTTLSNLYNYKKKYRHKEIPSGCYLYLCTLKRLFDLNVTFNKDIFYRLIEESFSREDHNNNVTYSTLQPAFSALEIDATVYLQWIKDKGYTPSTKLISHAKKQQKRKDRRKRSSASSARDAHMMKMRARRSARGTKVADSRIHLDTLTELEDENEGADEREESNQRKHLNLHDIRGSSSISTGNKKGMLDDFKIRDDDHRNSFDMRNSFDARNSFDTRNSFDMGSRSNSLVWDVASDGGSDWGWSDCTSDYGDFTDFDNTNSRSSFHFSSSDFHM